MAALSFNDDERRAMSGSAAAFLLVVDQRMLIPVKDPEARTAWVQMAALG